MGQPRTADGTGVQPGIGDVSLTLTTTSPRTRPPSPSTRLPSAPAPCRPSPSSSTSSSAGNLYGGPVSRRMQKPAPPPPAPRPRRGGSRRGPSEAPRVPQWHGRALGRPFSISGTAFGLSVASRASACAGARNLCRDCLGGAGARRSGKRASSRPPQHSQHTALPAACDPGGKLITASACHLPPSADRRPIAAPPPHSQPIPPPPALFACV